MQEPFEPPAQSQFQPKIPTSPKDCVPCSTRKAIRRSTVDAKAPTTAQIRVASGAPSTRGLTYGEAADAAAHFGVTLVPSYGNTRDEVFALADGGHAFCISIDCSVTLGTERSTNSYAGDHTVYANDVQHCAAGGVCLCEKRSSAKAHNEYKIEDPGNSSKGYQWWSASLMYRAAESRTTDHLGVSHGINLLVAQDTEGVTRTVVGVGKIRKTPSTNGTIAGTIPKKGTKIKVKKTVNGESWLADADGHTGNGWHYGTTPSGVSGYFRGEALV